MASRLSRASDVLHSLGLLFLAIIPAIGFAQNPFSLSEKDEIELGRLAAGETEKSVLLINDPAVVKYIDDLGQSLVQKSTRKEIAYTFKVVDSPEINAFALPGGFIYVNRGLIEAAETQDELAGVLAHEIGHVVARHGADQAVRTGLVQTGMGVFGGLLGRGTSSSLGKIAAEMVATGVFMKFSRQAERQADRLGARMVYDASLQPQGMVSFFNKLAGLQKSQPNAVLKFFSSHPSPAERSSNVSNLIASYPASSKPDGDSPVFRDVKQRLAALPRPEVEAAKAAAAIAAAAQPPAEPETDVRSRNMVRDRDVAARFAPVFHQALGPAPRFDYITNFDFDGDWRGDNNWNNAENRSYPLKAYVYYAVFETRTHFFIHYAAFHPRDYKGGEKRGALLSEVMRIGVGLGGQYDPTGRSNEAVMAHENDLEGALVVAEKDGEDYTKAQLTLVETLAHNNYLKYTPPGSSLPGDPIIVVGVRPRLFVESKGHGIEAWRDDADQHKMAENGFLVYVFTAAAEDPDEKPDRAVGYELLPTYESLWPHARSGKNETCGEEHDYGVVSAKFAQCNEDVLRHIRLGVMGSALNGVVGAANMSRPPWGWFDGQDRARPLGEWFLQPAETIRRRWNLPESFSTTYTYHPFLGQFR
ncbi:MAG TPA: M48 family metallopeptidase [Bryobacteraceae bacterium]|nr:M48 family metallopeptidase [Bryobacteraceae bacterium]